jgi:hypothetical protein
MKQERSRRNYYFAMEHVRRFIRGAKISGVLLVFTSAALACIYGVNPFVRVSYEARGLISLVWLWNVVVFTICGGMMLIAWLIDHYGDPPNNN